MDTYQDFLKKTTPEKRKLLKLLEHEGFYKFERIKKSKHTAIRFYYPANFDYDFCIELKSNEITPMRVAKLLINHTHHFHLEVRALLFKYMEEQLK